MRLSVTAVVSRRVWCALCILGCTGTGVRAADTKETETAKIAFRDSVNEPPPGYSGPVFKLSDDYPERLPAAEAPWLKVKVDFSSNEKPVWKDYAPYLDAILQYVVEGQNGQLTDEAGWNVQVGGQTRWFHVPWMAYDPKSGREFTHGCTNERTASYENFVGPLPFGDQMTSESFESWAFGVYNPVGAYSIGKTFPKSGVPAISKSDSRIPEGLPFAEGTLVAKVLFATATPEQVPFLKNSPKWTVNQHEFPGASGKKGTLRKLGPVRLVQMDVAVVDHRSPMRWVFGTFAYNGTLAGADAPWYRRMSPVGLQWGSDPWSFPATLFDDSQPVIQSVLAPINIFEHDGANGRLAGPVDNPLSSCLSCHQGAFAANPVGTPFSPGKGAPPIFGFAGMGTNFSTANVQYFQNTRFPLPYPDPAYLDLYPLDTSLQFQVGFSSYASYVSAAKKKKK